MLDGHRRRRFGIYSSIIELNSISIMELYAPRLQLISNKLTASLSIRNA